MGGNLRWGRNILSHGKIEKTTQQFQAEGCLEFCLYFLVVCHCLWICNQPRPKKVFVHPMLPRHRAFIEHFPKAKPVSSVFQGCSNGVLWWFHFGLPFLWTWSFIIIQLLTIFYAALQIVSLLPHSVCFCFLLWNVKSLKARNYHRQVFFFPIYPG